MSVWLWNEFPLKPATSNVRFLDAPFSTKEAECFLRDDGTSSQIQVCKMFMTILVIHFMNCYYDLIKSELHDINVILGSAVIAFIQQHWVQVFNWDAD